jgi:dienelactone hydrolase
MLPQLLLQLARHLLTAALFGGGLAVAAAQAADVELQLSDRVSATADFRPGKTGKPAVLVLHGFLQTREFGIVKSIADTLTDEGYTVLAPNLSLGISSRRNSLSCEALHLHDMEGDIEEIQRWVQWLLIRGYGRVIAVGHSFGASQLLAWREKHPKTAHGIIGISLVSSAPFVPTSGYRAIYSGKQQPDLLQFPLSFCEAYTAPASKHASYARWNDQKVLAALKSSSSATNIILGSEDKYLPAGWKDSLTKAGAKVHLLKGATHFMDGTQEFDLLEALLGILKR